MAGLHFLARADEALRAEGVEMIFRHATVKHDHGPMLERMGYALTERVYMRML